jgi:hypothetical protein
LLPAAAALHQQFPDTTRTWQVHGHARQLWFIARLNAADYEPLIPFLEEWIAEIEEEIREEKNAGFNQQMLLLLQCNLAIALNWSGDSTLAEPVWTDALKNAPEALRPAIGMLSQVPASRSALRDGRPLDLQVDENLVPSLEAFAGFVCAGPRYPFVHQVLAECHALAIKTLEQNPAPSAELVARIKTHRESALQSILTTQAAGFYHQADRRGQFRTDPLFESAAFQAAVPDR